MATYTFVDTWHVPASPERVYEILSRPRDYPGWWGEAFLEGDGDPTPAAPGKHARMLTRGRLPYRLRSSSSSPEQAGGASPAPT